MGDAQPASRTVLGLPEDHAVSEDPGDASTDNRAESKPHPSHRRRIVLTPREPGECHEAEPRDREDLVTGKVGQHELSH